jgi:hypothetical protein
MNTFGVVQVVAPAVLVGCFGAMSANVDASGLQDVPPTGAAMPAESKVRGVTSRMVALVVEGTTRSKTFDELVNRINNTDGIVYVAEGECGHEVQACLLFAITTAGENRVPRILVDRSKDDAQAIASLAHELQHALEVLSVRYIRTDAAMLQFYRRIGHAAGNRFETDAAVKAGDQVRRELTVKGFGARPSAPNVQAIGRF